MRKPMAVHPFLFALFPVVSIYLQNRPLAAPVEAVMAAALALALAVLLMVAFCVTTRDRAKGGIIATIALVLFFTYGHVHYLMEEAQLGHVVVGRHRYLMPAFATAFLLAVWLLRRVRQPENAVRVLNVIGLTVIVVAVAGVVPHELSRRSLTQRLRAEVTQRPVQSLPGPPSSEVSDKDLPDIYYIILDRYPAPSALRKFLNYNDRGFTDSLRARGFYVASESRANYVGTYLSLSSSLNMRHWNDLAPELKAAISSPSVIYEMLRNHEVGRLLRQRGYEYVHLGSWWLPTRMNLSADMNSESDGDEVMELPLVALQATMLHPFVREYAWGDTARRQRQRVLGNLRTMMELSEQPGGPRFVFAHFTVPHPPYVFAPDGRPLQMRETWRHTTRDLFLGQVSFINSQMMALVDHIQRHSTRQAVIVLQGDEGPRMTDVADTLEGTLPSKAYTDSPATTDEGLQLSSSVLNAYYLPGGGEKALYPTITPVNTFRVIFNRYLHTKYPLLPDNVYVSAGPKRPCDFTDITPRVR